MKVPKNRKPIKIPEPPADSVSLQDYIKFEEQIKREEHDAMSKM